MPRGWNWDGSNGSVVFDNRGSRTRSNSSPCRIRPSNYSIEKSQVSAGVWPGVFDERGGAVTDARGSLREGLARPSERRGTMARRPLKRYDRSVRLTPEQAARDRELRRKVEKEFRPLVRAGILPVPSDPLRQAIT